MIILKIVGSNPIEEPSGISFVDAPILVLIALLTIIVYALLKKRKNIRTTNESVDSAASEYAGPTNLDVLMQPKPRIGNGESLAFSKQTSFTRIVWILGLSITLLCLVLIILLN